MKDREVRFYVHKTLLYGIAFASVMSVLGLMSGGVWAQAAILSVLVLPLMRLSAEIYGFFKHGRKIYGVLSVIIICAILFSAAVTYYMY